LTNPLFPDTEIPEDVARDLAGDLARVAEGLADILIYFTKPIIRNHNFEFI